MFIIDQTEKEYLPNHCDLDILSSAEKHLVLMRYAPKIFRDKELFDNEKKFEEGKHKYSAKISELKSNAIKEPLKLTFVPYQKWHYQKLYSEASKAILKKIIELQRVVNEDIVVFPYFGGKDVKGFKKSAMNFLKLINGSKKKGCIINWNLLEKDFTLWYLIKSHFDFVMIRSYLMIDETVIRYYNVLEQVIDPSFPIFCTEIHIFVQSEPFLEKILRYPIAGYSLGYSSYNGPETYYDVSSNYPTRYKTKEQMIEVYGSSNVKLSTLCPCPVCAQHTIKSFFDQKRNQISIANKRHKMEYTRWIRDHETEGEEKGYGKAKT